MECPSCNGYNLKPIKLEFGLPARICSKCGGLLINLLSYRNWLDTAPEEIPLPQDAKIEAEEKVKPYFCKKCARIMLKYKISAESNNHIDLCTNCDEAFLDHGEWNILKYLKLHKKLAKIFTDPWQRKIATETENKNMENRFNEMLGSTDYQKLKETKAWIQSHEKSSDLIRYILKK